MSSRTPLSTKEVASSVHDELRNKTNNILSEGDSLIDQENRAVRERISNVQKTADSKFNDINAKGKLADTKINEAQELQSRAADKLFQAKELAHQAPAHITSPTRTSAQTTYSNSNSSLASTPSSNTYYKTNQEIDSNSGGMFSSIKGAFVGIKNDIASVFSSSSSSSTSAPSTSSNNYSTSSTSHISAASGAPLSHSSPPTTSASLVEGHKLAEGLAFPFNRANLDEQAPSSSSSSSLPSNSTRHPHLSKLEHKLENAEQSVISSAKRAEQKIERAEKKVEEKLHSAGHKVEEKYRAAERKAEEEAAKAKEAGENFASGIKGAFVGIKNDIASVFSSSSSTSSTPSISTSSTSANNTTHPVSDGIAFPFNRASNDDRAMHTSTHEMYHPYIAPAEHIVQKYVPPQAALVRQPLYEEIDLNSPSTLHALHTSTGKLAVNNVNSERSLMGEIKQRVHDIKDDFMRDSMMNDRARLMIDDDIQSPPSA